MYLTKKDIPYVAIDIETDGLDATKIHVCCAEDLDTGERWTFTSGARFARWAAADRIYIGHNSLSFDVPVLNRLWGSTIHPSQCVDTLVLSQLYNPRLARPEGYAGRSGPHSLAAWGWRLGDHKIHFEDWSELTDEMIEYCQQDVSVTLKVYRALSDRMSRMGYSETSCRIEHQFRFFVDKQQEHGFNFDKAGAEALYADLRGQQEALERDILDAFPPKVVIAGEYEYRVKKDGDPVSSFLRHQEAAKESGLELKFNKDGSKYRTFAHREFNIGSPLQRAERLLELGWKPREKTPKGSPKVDEASVLEFAQKSGNEAVGKIAEWLVLNGRANMINTWLEALHEDGRIHGSVMSCGAGSRRCTHSGPNTANVPSTGARYGHECRSLWLPDDGHVLVGCDASGLEGRVFIHYLGNPEAEEFMMNDPHTANAEAISRAVGFEVSRSLTKNIFYGRLYGASDKKLGSLIGKGAKHGKLARAAIDSNIPGFEDLLKNIQREFNANSGRLRTIDGGFVLCPGEHAAINYKFQSAGAIFMKQALIRLYQLAKGLEFFVVGNIHDEWQISCRPDHAEAVGQAACDAMTLAGEDLKFNLKMEGEYKIGSSWADTH